MTHPPGPIAGFEDWPEAVRRLGRSKGHNTASGLLAQALGVPAPISTPTVAIRRTRRVNGVQLQDLEWQLPYGPPTRAFLLRPTQTEGILPGVLWLHCHGGNKWLGAERLIDAGTETAEEVTALQQNLYSGHAAANDLARAGFAVLVHDSFSWGSRRFLLDPPPARAAEGLSARRALWREEGVKPTPAMEYNTAAALHEHTVAKTAGLLGTSYAGMVAFEDLAALDILRALPGVDGNRVGVGGFSGGGGRALVLSALAPQVRAAVDCCMMTTFKGLFPAHMDTHSWLLATPGLASTFEWPELTGINRDCRYLVQFAGRDPLLSPEGMHDADAWLRADAARADAARADADTSIAGTDTARTDTAQTKAGSTQNRYTGTWYDAGHIVTPAMLAETLKYLTVSL